MHTEINLKSLSLDGWRKTSEEWLSRDPFFRRCGGFCSFSDWKHLPLSAFSQPSVRRRGWWEELEPDRRSVEEMNGVYHVAQSLKSNEQSAQATDHIPTSMGEARASSPHWGSPSPQVWPSLGPIRMGWWERWREMERDIHTFNCLIKHHTFTRSVLRVRQKLTPCKDNQGWNCLKREWGRKSI